MHAVDVAVVGAGPVGCVAALAHARRGARVALIEAQSHQGKRFAGELLHPPAVAALREVGIERIPAAEGHEPNRGFAVFSPELEAPRCLSHTGGGGITFEFNRFVSTLREAATAHPDVRYLPAHRVVGLQDDVLALQGEVESVRADRIIGADGRFSAVRRLIDGPGGRTVLSHMAGLVLRGVTLPHEGYGHVVLGGPGPVLLYRIAPDEVRVCIDVPASWRRLVDRTSRIADAILPHLPEEVRPAVLEELDAGRVVWAVNEVRPRTFFGAGRVLLVGDAVGHGHPMTGVGMTLGFEDAVASARHDSLESYRTERHRASRAPALLSTALYEIFSVQSLPTTACREAIYRIWDSEDLRRISLSLLTAEEARLTPLLAVGTRMVARAVGTVLSEPAPLADRLAAVGRLGGLIRWLLQGALHPELASPTGRNPRTPFEVDRALGPFASADAVS